MLGSRGIARLVSAAVAVCIVAALPTPATAQAATHKIVSIDRSHDGRTVTSVRLSERVSEPDLKALAAKIRAQAPADKKPATLNFYLPSMELNSAGWADVVFADGVEAPARVTIRGLRLEEVRAYRAAASSDQRALIGVWLTSPPALAGKLTIWRDKDRTIFSEWELRTGTKTIDELTETRSQRGRRYVIDGGDGGYYLALWNGALELGDASNVIAIAERLTLDTPKSAPLISAQQSGGTQNGDRSGVTAPAVGDEAAGLALPVARPRKVVKAKSTVNAKPSKAPTSGDLISAAMGR